MTDLRALIAIALIVAVALSATVLRSAGQLPLVERGPQATAGPFWLGWGSTTVSGFRELGLPAMTEVAGRVKVDGPDGAMPELVTASLRSLMSASDILAHYVAACRSLGLSSPASAEALISRPELLCEGPYRGYSVGVIVAPHCTQGECRVHLELQGVPR